MSWPVFATLVFAYLLGSIPFGLLAGKLCGKDLRREGSGNIGATNALRVLGKGWGYTVFALDCLKGALPVLTMRAILSETNPQQAASLPGEAWILAGGLLAILGHNFPVWLGFKGGKGIATSAGVIAALFPPLYFAAVVALWVLVFFTTRYVSLASIGAGMTLFVLGIAAPLAGWISPLLGTVSILIGILGIWRHRANLARLRDGTEPRFSRKSSP